MSQAIVESYGAWWLVGGITAPAAELGDHPGGPGESSVAMRIFLQDGPALQGFVDGVDRRDLFGGEGKACRLGIAAIAGLDELNNDGRRFGGNGDQLVKPISGSQLAVLDLQTLALHRPEKLLDEPTQLVPGDDLPGVSAAAEFVGGEQKPVQGFGALGG